MKLVQLTLSDLDALPPAVVERRRASAHYLRVTVRSLFVGEGVLFFVFAFIPYLLVRFAYFAPLGLYVIS